MNAIDLSHPIKNETLKPGTVLMKSSHKVTSIVQLHSGMAELVSADNIRIGLVRGDSVCGITGLYSGRELEYSVIAVSECVISNTPVPESMVMHTLQQDMDLNIQILQALVQRIESAAFLFKNYKYLWHKLASIQDSIALGIDLSSRDSLSDDLDLPDSVEISDDGPTSDIFEDRYFKNLEKYSSQLKEAAENQEASITGNWNPNYFLDRVQDSLGLYNQYDNQNMETLVDYSQYLFFKRLLRKQPKVIAALFEDDEPGNYYVFQFLSTVLETMIAGNLKISRNISQISDLLFADNGWVQSALDAGDESSFQFQQFRHYLWKFSWRCHRDAIKLLRRDFTEHYRVFSELKNYKSAPLENKTQLHPADEGETSTPESGATASTSEELSTGKSNSTQSLAKYRGLLDKILEFSEKPEEWKQDFRDSLQQVKQIPDAQSTEKAFVEIRQKFSRMYWELYEVCFLNIIDSDLKSFVPGIMLHLGLIDETMVSEEELRIIDDTYAKMLYIHDPLPVMTLPYFLEKIYTGEVLPSINEMGESFREVLKSQERLSRKERLANPRIFTDTPEDKVSYELSRISLNMAGLLFGSKAKSVPVLSSAYFMGSLGRTLLDPEQTSRIAEKLVKRDFSLFYREVVCKHDMGTDLVKQEVFPNLVLYPLCGSRMMMWQELDGPRKDSTGRLILPLVFSEKAEESLTGLFGQFRWELSRSVAGANWMDPVEGGMAGAYYDYIQFYKKNPNLSPDHKEKLREFIKKTRSDRDRFCADYITWLLYEYEGKVRFNPVIRDIFYRYVPFDRDIRETMKLKPLFSDLETKFQNRRRKELLRVESRLKKFEKSSSPLPELIQKYYDFLNM